MCLWDNINDRLLRQTAVFTLYELTKLVHLHVFTELFHKDFSTLVYANCSYSPYKMRSAKKAERLSFKGYTVCFHAIIGQYNMNCCEERHQRTLENSLCVSKLKRLLCIIKILFREQNNQNFSQSIK